MQVVARSPRGIRSAVRASLLTLLSVINLPAGRVAAQGFSTADLYKIRAVGSVEMPGDGRHVAYTVTMHDRPGRPYEQVWILDLTTQKSIRVGGAQEATADPLWSPDGKWLAYSGGDGDRAGLWVVQSDGSGASFLAPVMGTNTPIPEQGPAVTWSPDSRRVAFISAAPGPETVAATGDPILITRYMYKPVYTEGMTHFGDNRRLHIFVVDVAGAGPHEARQLTNGTRDEHSIDWSPDGTEILFASNYEANQDEFFHYDLFTVAVADGRIRRLTTSEACAYAPRWSPDGKWIAYAGTTRGLTDRETTMEDTHVWLIDAHGGHRQDIGAALDDRQGYPRWSPDGGAVWFTVRERGSVHLARVPVAAGIGAQPQIVVRDVGVVEDFSIGKGGGVAYALATPHDAAELYVRTATAPPRQLTNLNAELFTGKTIAPVDSFTFMSNDGKYAIEAFLTRPAGLAAAVTADTMIAQKYPLIVNIHGGPHGDNGPAFDMQSQVFASHGWATLEVNYRGSTSYGEKFSDAIFGDLDGEEGQDVLYGVSAAVRQNLWIDRERMGIEGVSYGGQLTDWLITQTNEFKAAVPIAGISNLISTNYMQYMNQWEEGEYGQFLHQGDLMDRAWEHSALRHVANVHTPTMLMHGENDPDVPIAEDEQYYVALKDVGVEVVMVRYPREGHGLHETKHVADALDRRIAWYQQHFDRPGAAGITNVQP